MLRLFPLFLVLIVAGWSQTGMSVGGSQVPDDVMRRLDALVPAGRTVEARQLASALQSIYPDDARLTDFLAHLTPPSPATPETEAAQAVLAAPAVPPTLPSAAPAASVRGKLDAGFDWLLGTWKLTRVWSVKVGSEEKEEFVGSGRVVEGYQISRSGVRAAKPDLRGKIDDSGIIHWECYIPADDPEGIFVFRDLPNGLSVGRPAVKPGDSFYPSGWQPVISSMAGGDRNSLEFVIPCQTDNPRTAAQRLKNRRMHVKLRLER